MKPQYPFAPLSHNQLDACVHLSGAILRLMSLDSQEQGSSSEEPPPAWLVSAAGVMHQSGLFIGTWFVDDTCLALGCQPEDQPDSHHVAYIPLELAQSRGQEDQEHEESILELEAFKGEIESDSWSEWTEELWTVTEIAQCQPQEDSLLPFPETLLQIKGLRSHHVDMQALPSSSWQCQAARLLLSHHSLSSILQTLNGLAEDHWSDIRQWNQWQSLYRQWKGQYSPGTVPRQEASISAHDQYALPAQNNWQPCLFSDGSSIGADRARGTGRQGLVFWDEHEHYLGHIGPRLDLPPDHSWVTYHIDFHPTWPKTDD